MRNFPLNLFNFSDTSSVTQSQIMTKKSLHLPSVSANQEKQKATHTLGSSGRDMPCADSDIPSGLITHFTQITSIKLLFLTEANSFLLLSLTEASICSTNGTRLFPLSSAFDYYIVTLEKQG